MSRRALSFSKSKTSISPIKSTPKSVNCKLFKLPQSTLPPRALATPIINAFKNRLIEKYSSISQGLKKISELYPSEISIQQFKSILKSLKLKFLEKDLKDFIKIYGRTQKISGCSGISIDDLTKSMHSSVPVLLNHPSTTRSMKMTSLANTQSFSTRSSHNLLDKSPNKLKPSAFFKQYSGTIQKGEKKEFLAQLVKIFGTPELAVEYFFVDRDPEIDFEDFSESVQRLGLSNLYLDSRNFFFEISNQKKSLSEAQLLQEILTFQSEDYCEPNKLLESSRMKLRKVFGSHVKAFEEIACGSETISCQVMEGVLKKLGVTAGAEEFKELFDCYADSEKLQFKGFKEFWTGIVGVCSFKSCEEQIESLDYCKRHSHFIITKGEEIYSKLKMIMKTDHLNSFLQEVIQGKANKKFYVNGFELQAADAKALQEFIRTKGLCKLRVANSVKNRV